jgi:hypothetical protein
LTIHGVSHNKRSILNLQTDGAMIGYDQQLLLSGQFHEHRRRIGGRIIQRAPSSFARQLVVGHDRSAFRSARLHNHLVPTTNGEPAVP